MPFATREPTSPSVKHSRFSVRLDLLGLSRQVTVLAYQYGPGLFGQFSPTDGALIATLALAGVRYSSGCGSLFPLCLVLFVLASSRSRLLSQSG